MTFAIVTGCMVLIGPSNTVTIPTCLLSEAAAPAYVTYWSGSALGLSLGAIVLYAVALGIDRTRQRRKVVKYWYYLDTIKY